MSLVGILHFALKSLDVLSWPFFALGYPLFASIRAIEKNSSSDTQKLVTYWIAFSLILLFENAFLKLLERLWLWPHMKLMIICWLVVPHFDGAVYVYNHLLHPCLSMNPLVIIHEFNRWKEFLLKRDDFLAEAERYIKENGTEALEELIATKIKSKMSNYDMEEIKAIAVMEKKEVEWSNSKEPNIVQKDSKAVEVTEKKEVPAAKRVVPAEPNLEQTENTTSATKEIEGPTVAVERTRELPDIPMPKEVQKKWTCDICELTVESDKVLNLHLQGKKHKAKYEALKAKNQPNIIPASTAEETEQPVEEPQNNVTAKVLIQKTITNHEEKQQGQPTSITVAVERTRELPDIPMPKEVQKEWTCDICEPTVESDKVLNSHLQGKKHKATYEALKAKNQPNIIPASTAEETEQPVEEPQNNVTAKVLIQKTITNHEEKQQGQPTSITVAVERTRELPDIPMPKEVQKEWTCDICELTVESDKVLNSHLQGKKHKATYEALKANQPNIIPASTAEETEQPVEEPQNNVTAKVLIQKTITNHEEKQQGQPTSILTSSAKKSDQPMREEAEKGVSNSELEQKKQAVKVTEKNEVPAAKRVVPAEPNLEQTVNTTSAMPKEGLTVAVATTRELPDIPMPKEVQKEWTCDICQLTVACEKILNSHLQGKKHKTALKAKDQPTVEEPQKSVSSKELKQRIVTKYEEKQQGQQTIASASTAMKSNQPTKEESEKRVSNSELEQKEEAVGVKDSTLRCNICNISCSGENNLVSHFNGRKHLARIRLMIESVGSGQV